MNDHRPFGRTGLEIPPVVFGSTSLGNLFRATPAETKLEIVRQWTTQVAPPVFIDSAGKYGAGLALEELSRTLCEIHAPAADVVIMNKLGWRRVPLTAPEPTFEPGVWQGLQHDAVLDISYEGIQRCWEQGRRLVAPYRPRLASVHDPDEYLALANSSSDRTQRWDDIFQAYRALSELKQAGEIDGVGVGAKDWTVIRKAAEQCELDWVMFATSLTLFTHPPALLSLVEQLSSAGIGVINSSLFHSGFLVGGEFFDYQRLTPNSSKCRKLTEWRSRFFELCMQFDVEPQQAAITFGASPPGVAAIALSSSSPSRVAAHVAAARANSIPHSFWVAMKDQRLIDRAYPYLG